MADFFQAPLHLLILISAVFSTSCGLTSIRVYFDAGKALDVEIQNFDYNDLSTNCLVFCQSASSTRLIVSGQRLCRNGSRCDRKAYTGHVSNRELIIKVSRSVAGNSIMFEIQCLKSRQALQINNHSRSAAANSTRLTYINETSFTANCITDFEVAVTAPGSSATGPTTTVIAVSIVTVSILIILLSIIAVLIVRRRRRRKNGASQDYEPAVPRGEEHDYSSLSLSVSTSSTNYLNTVERTDDGQYEDVESERR